MLERNNKIRKFTMIVIALGTEKNSHRVFFTLSAIFTEYKTSASAVKSHMITALGANCFFFTENIMNIVFDKCGKTRYNKHSVDDSRVMTADHISKTAIVFPF